MNNEEKILSLLEILVDKVDRLEQGQTKLEQRQTKLEQEVNNIRELQLSDSKKLEAVYNFSPNLHEKQVTTNQTLDVISNELKTVELVAQVNSFDIAKLKAVK